MKTTLTIPSGQLRPALPEDCDGIVSLLRDKEVRRFLCDDRIVARAEVEDMLAESARLDADGQGLWVIEGERNGLAGIVGLAPVSAEASVSPDMAGGIEPTIALAPTVHGRGLASEAMTAIIAHARSTLGLSHLVAAVDEPNAQSHRLMERSGFQVMGTAPGPAHALVLYELLLQPATDA